jgi:3-deoxy-D-manno-octulosonate 8-phosphate phosphatase (KDO 8-P phosphatase)
MKEAVDFVSTKNGGSGAVREFIELILKKNGKWEEILKLF